MYSINISKEEFQIILESLLYTASIDLDHSQYQEDLIKITQLAIKLRLMYPQAYTTNVTYIEEISHPSSYTREILKFFPEIRKKI